MFRWVNGGFRQAGLIVWKWAKQLKTFSRLMWVFAEFIVWKWAKQLKTFFYVELMVGLGGVNCLKMGWAIKTFFRLA